MEKIAIILTDYIKRNTKITKTEYEIYHYGFQVGIELLIFLISALIVSAFLGMIEECIIFLVVFIPVRSYVGGLHLKSFRMCFILSCLALFLTLESVQNLSIPIEIAFILSIMEEIIIFYVKPIKNSNRPVAEEQEKVFGKRLQYILLTLFIINSFFFIFKIYNFLLTITYTFSIIIISQFGGKVKTAQKENKCIKKKMFQYKYWNQ